MVLFFRTGFLSSFRCSVKLVLICILVLFAAIALTTFSIYLARQYKNQVALTSMNSSIIPYLIVPLLQLRDETIAVIFNTKRFLLVHK